MTRRSASRRGGLVLITVAALAGGVWAAARPRADHGVAPRPTLAVGGPADHPLCDDIGGEELARTKRWRVVHTGDGGPYGEDDRPTPVVACDRTVPGPARVRLLGMAKVSIEGGDDGGPYVAEAGAGGDVVLIASTFYEQVGNTGGFREKGFTTLFDLARGVKVRLPGEHLQRSSYFHDSVVDHELLAYVSSDGALAASYLQRDGRHARTRLGRVTIWDTSGRRELDDASAAIAFRDAGRGRPALIYSRTTGGTNRRTELRGAADTSGVPSDPALAWRWLALDHQNADEREAYEEDPPGNRYPGVGPSSRATVLDGDHFNAIVIGRFAPNRSVRSVRLSGRLTTARQRAFFARATPPAPGRHAAAVVGSNHVYAYTDGTTLWLWNHRSGGHTYPVMGLHDLAISDQAVFGTDAGSAVRIFGPWRRVPPPANDVPNPPDDGGVPPPNG